MTLFRNALLGFALVGFVCDAASRADVLLDQQPAGFSSFVACTTFGTWEADDFMFSDADYVVERVAWWGGRNDPHTPVIDGFYVRFYDSVFDAALGQECPGTLLSEYHMLGDAGQHTDAYSHQQYFAYAVDLPSAFVAMGLTRYWVSVVADLSNDPNDPWWGWRTSDSAHLETALVKQPGAEFVRISDPPFHVPYQGMALVLEGRPVPAPWVVAPLAAQLIQRRRRR